MKHRLSLISMFALVSFAAFAAPAAAAPPNRARPTTTASPRRAPLSYEPGQVLVIPVPASVVELDAARRSRSTAVGDAMARHGLSPAARSGGPRGSSLQLLRLESSRTDFDPVAAARELRATGAFRAAIPNYHLRPAITIPNDPYVLPEQWYIQAPNDADVDLPDAWDLERGSASVVIGILDSGVDLGHPDLAGKFWTNPGEIPGNSLDDEGDGYVDDVNGWDFGDGDSDPNPNPMFDAATDIDIGFHGTFVAGIAAASTNNNEGIAGAAWHCPILPLKVTNSAGVITSEAVASAFEYAAFHQIEVLNASLGAVDEPGVPEFFQALVDLADSAGVLVVSSAGNSSEDAPSYPAASAGAVSVAATDRSQFRASFSNWGSWVDLAAPGAEMWSMICRNYAVDEYSEIFYLYLWYWDGTNPYMYGDGTSFATPLVSGAAALVRSRYPALTPAQVKAHLKATGDSMSYDLPIGRKLNALAALGPPSVADVSPRPEPQGLSFASAEPNPSSGRVRFRFAVPAAGRVSLTIHDTQGRRVRRVLDGDLAAGGHRAAWDGLDAAGRPAGAGVYFATLEAAGHAVVRRVARLR